MDRLIAVIGYSNSGKTTLIESLVPELKRRGWRVGTVKHTHHDPEFDQVGKDSWRHFEAGAETAILYSEKLLSLVMRRQAPEPGADGLEGLDPLFRGMDIIIAEGFKSAGCPKIEVYRPAAESFPLCRTVEGVIAVVCDVESDFPVPRFGFSQVSDLAGMIEDRLIRRLG